MPSATSWAGDIRGRVDLTALAGAGSVWGLGPLEGVRGEVSIFGGEPSIARVERDAVVTTHGWQVRACFLVWAQVPRWEERTPRVAAAEGDSAYAVIKASDVMVGKD